MHLGDAATLLAFLAFITNALAQSQPAFASPYTFVSCWTDTGNPRTLKTAEPGAGGLNNMTIENCAAGCNNAGFKFMGVEYYHECWCGNEIDASSSSAANSNCNLACAGDEDEFCGGEGYLSLYSIGGDTNPAGGGGGSGDPNNPTGPTCDADNNTQFTDANGNTYEVRCKTEYAGNDIGNSPGTNLGDCATQCDDFTGCTVVVFTGINGAGGQCYFKSAAVGGSSSGAVDAIVRVQGGSGGNPTTSTTTTTTSSASSGPTGGTCPDPGTVTAPVCSRDDNETYTADDCRVFTIRCNYDCPGDNLASGAAATASDCIEYCDGYTGCVAASYFQGYCYLKGSSDECATNNQGVAAFILVSGGGASNTTSSTTSTITTSSSTTSSSKTSSSTTSSTTSSSSTSSTKTTSFSSSSTSSTTSSSSTSTKTSSSSTKKSSSSTKKTTTTTSSKQTSTTSKKTSTSSAKKPSTTLKTTSSHKSSSLKPSSSSHKTSHTTQKPSSSSRKTSSSHKASSTKAPSSSRKSSSTHKTSTHKSTSTARTSTTKSTSTKKATSTKSSPSPTPTPTFRYYECMKYKSTYPLLVVKKITGLTLEKCAQACQQWDYFGLTNGRGCRCGNAIHTDKYSSTNCSAVANVPCEGDTSEPCGGQSAMLIYGDERVIGNGTSGNRQRGTPPKLPPPPPLGQGSPFDHVTPGSDDRLPATTTSVPDMSMSAVPISSVPPSSMPPIYSAPSTPSKGGKGGKGSGKGGKGKGKNGKGGKKHPPQNGKRDYDEAEQEEGEEWGIRFHW